MMANEENLLNEKVTLNDWFESGMTTEDYIDSMKINKKDMLHVYETFALTEEERAFFTQLQAQQLRVIALTADWCGDAMLSVPILMHIADTAAMDIRLLVRDNNLELMDQYLTNGTSRSIPIFIFIDESGDEKAVWGPRAPEVQQLIDDLRTTIPAEDDPTYEEKQREMYRTFKARILSDESLWRAVSRSLQDRLQPLI